MFEPDLQEYAHGTLESWDVEVLLNEVVESVTPTGVTLKSDERVIPERAASPDARSTATS